MIKHFIYVFSFLLLLLGVTSNRLKAKEYNPLFLYNQTTLNGLPHNEIQAILKDSDGFMWFGTKSGLSRFDGHEIKNYSKLFEYEILSLEEFDPHTLLIGTTSSLFIYDKKRDEVIPCKEIGSTRIKAIRKADDKSFLVGSETGLFLFSNDGKIISKIILDKGIAQSNHITSILKKNENIFWISTANGLASYNLSNQKTSFHKMIEDADHSNYFRCISRLDSTIYLGSLNKGIFSFNLEKQAFSKIQSFKNNFILAIDNNGKDLFVGTDGKGLIIYSIEKHDITSEIVRGNGMIKSNTITSLKFYDNILWIGSLSNGFSYTPSVGNNFSFFKTPQLNTANYNVRSSFIFNNGDKLIGTRSGLIFVSEENSFVKEFTTDNKDSYLRSDIILNIQQLGETILVGTYGGGLYKFNKASTSLSNFSNNSSFLNGCFFRSAIDSQNNLWFATNEGVFKTTQDGKILKRYEQSNSGLNDNVVLFLYIDSNDRVWACTHYGINLIEPETDIVKTNIFSPEFKNILEFVNYIIEDSNKNIWFCTNQGVLIVDKNLMVKAHYSEAQNFPENVIKSAVEDDLNNIWFSTLRYIVKYNLKTNVFSFQYMEGLATQVFNNNVQKASDGSIWWANEGGLVYANNKDSGSNKIKYHPTITSVSISNIEYDPTKLDNPDNLTLSSSENNIRIKMSYMNYSLPNTDIFEYRLEGYDSEWKRITGENEVTYLNLPSGNYVFKMRVPNDHSNQKSFYIKISRSYTTIIWIIAIAVISLILIVYFLLKLKMIKSKIKKERIILTEVQVQSKIQTVVNISEDRVDELLDKLMRYMQADKPYLDPKLKIRIISDKLKCDVSDLSQILNNVLNVNFADFINVYRINEFKEKLESQNLSRFTIKGLSEQCGFNSKSTFYRVFKKVTNKTPLEYCKEKGITIAED